MRWEVNRAASAELQARDGVTPWGVTLPDSHPEDAGV